MLIPLFIACTSCGQELAAEFDTIKHKLRGTCGKCNTDNGHPVDPGFHIGHSLIAYASASLDKDPNLAILFAGMAADAYLSHIFLKWRDIEELNTRKNSYSSTPVREELFVEMRSLMTFAAKAERIVQLTYPQGLAAYFSNNPALVNEITSGFPKVNHNDFVKSIEKELLWKRNDVVHVGKLAYSRDEGLRAINHGKIFIKVFEGMEAWRRTNG